MNSIFSKRGPFRSRGSSWAIPVVNPGDGGSGEVDYGRYLVTSNADYLVTTDGFRIGWTPAAA